jgi:hypothetical protein
MEGECLKGVTRFGCFACISTCVGVLAGVLPYLSELRVLVAQHRYPDVHLCLRREVIGNSDLGAVQAE